MLLGKHPFEGDTLEALFDNIKNKELNLYYLVKLDCSEESKDFIIKCLNKDYKKRITTSECLEHPWINKFCFRKNSNLITFILIINTIYKIKNIYLIIYYLL